MALETNHQELRTAEGTPRIALDDGAKAEVNRSVQEARAQFDAAFANLARTIEGENTVRGGTADISGFGAKDSLVSRAAQTIIEAIRGDREQQLATAQSHTRGGHSR